MTRLNVRCCCTPTKILGTLPAPDAGQRSRVFVLSTAGLLRFEVRTFQGLIYQTTDEALAMMPPEVEARMVSDMMASREPAYFADETPLEHLRLIPEFREGEKV